VLVGFVVEETTPKSTCVSSLEFGIPSRLVGESANSGSHTYFADMNVACAARFDLDPGFFQDFALCGLPNGLTRVHSTTRQPDVLAARAHRRLCHQFTVRCHKQASHNLTEGSCFHEHSFQKDVAIIFIIKICICCVHASQVGIFVNLLSMATASACFVTTPDNANFTPDLAKVNAASADACWALCGRRGALVRTSVRARHVLAQGGAFRDTHCRVGH
jgi:hypothetical protein